MRQKKLQQKKLAEQEMEVYQERTKTEFLKSLAKKLPSHQKIMLENKKKKLLLQNQKQQNPNLVMKEEKELMNLKVAIQKANQMGMRLRVRMMVLKIILMIRQAILNLFLWNKSDKK